MSKIILDNEHAGRKVIMATGPERQLREKGIAAEEDLALLRDAAAPFQFDAQLLTDGTASAIASDHVPCSDLGRPAIRIPDVGVDAGSVLHKADQFASKADIRLRQAFDSRFQQRLERILRDELVRLKRQRAIIAAATGLLHGRDRCI